MDTGFFDWIDFYHPKQKISASISSISTTSEVISLSVDSKGYVIMPDVYIWQKYSGLTVTFDTLSKSGLNKMMERMIRDIRKSVRSATVWSAHRVSSTCVTFVIPDSKDLDPVASFLSQYSSVLFVSIYSPISTFNAIERGILQSNSFSPQYSRDSFPRIEGEGIISELNGINEVIGVADTGLDCKHSFFHDPEVPVPFGWIESNPDAPLPHASSAHRKLVSYMVGYYNNGDSNDMGYARGHGTHVVFSKIRGNFYICSVGLLLEKVLTILMQVCTRKMEWLMKPNWHS